VRRNSFELVIALVTACRSESTAEPRRTDTHPDEPRSAAAEPVSPQTAPPSAALPGPRLEPTRAPARDITIPPPDVDVHVINGRNILSAPLETSAQKAPSPSAPSPGPSGVVRVTFWTTPEGAKLPEPQYFEGALADIELGLGDLPMLSPGEKRRLWIPGPTGMATLDVELLAARP
jgi:hypothetical protein